MLTRFWWETRLTWMKAKGYTNNELMTTGSAGAANPTEVTNGYQFWTQTDDEGYFLLEDVRVGNYSLYAWVPGFIGDYKYNLFINIRSGSRIKLGELEYVSPRNGATIWELVSTSPTTDGNVAIDTSHQYATIKWLREKPLAKFMDAQWLLILKAEEQKLIKVTIKLPETVLTKLISDSNENYLSDGVSKSAQLWNEQRKLILHDAFFDFLLPSMEKEAKSLLAGRAKSWLIMEYGKLLWDRVCVAPYQRKEQNLRSDEKLHPELWLAVGVRESLQLHL
ncbi:hypothetical protein POM88_001433 [Heracleum sosnowskyi]|uniref:Rhamnogalacturonan lyase domain-containing protein n=1 Tax=Heracleum sosnowskyi TaxID=360622 RepID=A0AAD8JDJ4_9APIA|nr:hypothetical protein POM88_001433 [Heracleum sosnowskyi]